MNKLGLAWIWFQTQSEWVTLPHKQITRFSCPWPCPARRTGPPIDGQVPGPRDENGFIGRVGQPVRLHSVSVLDLRHVHQRRLTHVTRKKRQEDSVSSRNRIPDRTGGFVAVKIYCLIREQNATKCLSFRLKSILFRETRICAVSLLSVPSFSQNELWTY